MALREDQVRRYARHVLLPDVGGHGQERLLAAMVTVEVQPGDAAAIVALAYLAAAGVGRVRLTGAVDDPVTERDVAVGILYRPADLGRPRFEILAARVQALNPDVTVTRTDAPADVAVAPTGDLCEALIHGGHAATRALARLANAAPKS
ncbi:MAG TPA: ThiF family adenylyltransferase [Kofleriaceae bacterium]|nr:ThiF family adenylyltransferase [Kofleriaceae bacterium]